MLILTSRGYVVIHRYSYTLDFSDDQWSWELLIYLLIIWKSSLCKTCLNFVDFCKRDFLSFFFKEYLWLHIDIFLYFIFSLFPSFAEHTRVWIFSVCSFMLSSLLFHVVYKKCLTLCDPMECTVHGVLQARILEWVALPFFRGSFQPRDRTQVSHIAGGFFTSWNTREAQEHWSG